MMLISSIPDVDRCCCKCSNYSRFRSSNSESGLAVMSRSAAAHITATQAEAGWLAHFQLTLLIPVLSPSTLPGAASLHPPTIHAKQSGYGFCRDLKGDPVGRFATTLGSHAHTRRLNFCRT
jgi:hypothetical protein